MVNVLAIIFGVMTLLLGLRGLAFAELPWTTKKTITGTWARVLGAGCVALGCLFVAIGRPRG